MDESKRDSGEHKRSKRLGGYSIEQHRRQYGGNKLLGAVFMERVPCLNREVRIASLPSILFAL